MNIGNYTVKLRAITFQELLNNEYFISSSGRLGYKMDDTHAFFFKQDETCSKFIACVEKIDGNEFVLRKESLEK